MQQTKTQSLPVRPANTRLVILAVAQTHCMVPVAAEGNTPVHSVQCSAKSRKNEHCWHSRLLPENTGLGFSVKVPVSESTSQVTLSVPLSTVHREPGDQANFPSSMGRCCEAKCQTPQHTAHTTPGHVPHTQPHALQQAAKVPATKSLQSHHTTRLVLTGIAQANS